ncbi:hypothetical protein YC2023_016444 [Brassica napus]
MDASKPFFKVGEYWDSLNFTNGEMIYNQDAHLELQVHLMSQPSKSSCGTSNIPTSSSV